ncbi:MAG: nuclear transport factor 2 family protein [Sphingobacteriia bacterium]|nr:nuclear transport factor 2 family protein [Sphingobacteriia bacterium]
MNTNKEIAIHFLQLAAKGDARDAFNLYADAGFLHHNCHFKGDAETLIEAMEVNARENPSKMLEIKHSLEEGDLVAVHSHIWQNAADPGAAVVHLFRFVNNKIVEMWDVAQAVPTGKINENGMF